MSVEKLYIGACLEPVGLGEKYEHLPPHLTLVPPFQIERSMIPALHEGMTERAEENPSIRIAGADEAMFGPGNNKIVREVGGFMFQLHAASLMLVKKLGGEIDTRFTGQAWRPHVSARMAIESGEERIISEYQLFRYLADDVKLVQAIYDAEGARIYEG